MYRSQFHLSHLAVVFFILTLLPITAHSQTGLYFGLVTGTYSMGDYKEIQSHIASQSTTTLAKNFPASIGYQLEVNFLVRGNRFGFYSEYAKATSSFHGESMAVKRYVFGLVDYANIGKYVSLGGRIGLDYSVTNTDGLVYYGTSFQSVRNPSFTSAGFGFEPFFALTLPAQGGDFRFTLGYEINSQSRSAYTENSALTLPTPSHKDAKANWSGVRFSFAYGLHTGKKWKK